MIYIGIGIVLFVISFSYFKYNENKEQKRMNDHQITILNNSIEIDLPDIIGSFDAFVEMIMNQYLDLNFNFRTDSNYINTEMEEELLRNISKEVMDSISAFMVHKLSLVYKIVDEDDLANIITKTVYLKLLKFVTETNAIKENK